VLLSENEEARVWARLDLGRKESASGAELEPLFEGVADDMVSLSVMESLLDDRFFEDSSVVPEHWLSTALV
jgi:hypothetical protein